MRRLPSTLKMPFTPDFILAVFSYPSLNKIEGGSAYPQLCIIQNKMSTNTVVVPFNLGCQNFGLLALTMNPMVSSTPVSSPVNPGAQPNLNICTMTYVVMRAFKKHAQSVQIFKEYWDVGHVFVCMLYNMVNNSYTTFVNRSTLDT